MNKEEFIYIGRRLYEEGLVDSHAGNISVRDGDNIYITRRDVMLSEIKEADIIKLPITGPSPEDESASRELPTHRDVYASTSAKAIIHAHPPHAVGLSITENKIVPQDAEAQYLIKGAPIIRVREAIGSTEAAKYLVTNAYNNGYVVAMVKGHGSFAIGDTLMNAYKYTSCLENACKILFVVKTVEGTRGRSGGGESGGRDRRGPQGRDRSPQGRDERRTAIPRGIGVMDRSSRGRREREF